MNFKIVNSEIVFREFPDEITLAMNMSNCPCHCKNCHSQYLSKDIGATITAELIDKAIKEHPEITCVGIMGGDADAKGVNDLAYYFKNIHKSIKVGWYSGRDELSKEIVLDNFDYIKIGHYDEDCGPLDNRNTNQRLYKVSEGELEDITYKFWRD